MDYLKLYYHNSNSYIAYRKLSGNRASIVFCGGFASNMNGTKATALYEYCKENDIALVLFDYLGHGYSSGEFTDYTISDWCNNCVKVIDELTNEKQIIIGSSMGGWLMLLTALQIPQSVQALIGVSSAPDFTEDLIFQKLSTTQLDALKFHGIVEFLSMHDKTCTYMITNKLITDGRKHLILNGDILDINCPIRLLHGINDKDVPYETTLKIVKKLKSDDVEVHLIKSAGHSMSSDHEIKLLFNTIEKLL